MSDKDEPKANERASDSDEDRDSDAEIDSEPSPAPAKKTAAKAGAGSKRREPAARAPASAAPSGSASRVGVLVLLALLAGGAGGWFGHIQQAKAAAAKADSAPAPVGSTGAAAAPCGVWSKKICTSGGDSSAACMQAKAASELLTPSTCEAALANMPATLSRLKASRASCEKLVSKLCADLPPGSQTCKMVQDKTPAFPKERCDEMLKQYADVIGQLKQMDEGQAGGMQAPGGHGGPGGPGGPGMSAPPGMPPH